MPFPPGTAGWYTERGYEVPPWLQPQPNPTPWLQPGANQGNTPNIDPITGLPYNLDPNAGTPVGDSFQAPTGMGMPGTAEWYTSRGYQVPPWLQGSLQTQMMQPQAATQQQAAPMGGGNQLAQQLMALLQQAGQGGMQSMFSPLGQPDQNQQWQGTLNQSVSSSVPKISTPDYLGGGGQTTATLPSPSTQPQQQNPFDTYKKTSGGGTPT